MIKKALFISLVIIFSILTISCAGTDADTQEEPMEDTYIFTEETIRQCRPYTFSEDAAAALGLAGDGAFTDEYFRLQAFYGAALWSFLSAQADFEAVDQGIAESDMRIIPRTRYQTVYQQAQAYGLKYLYLRNNLMIEHLTQEQLASLRALCAAADTGSEAALAFIEDTWKLVITQNPDYPEDLLCILDLTTGQRVENCSLLIGLDSMFELNASGGFADAEHEKEKAEFLTSLADALSRELTDVFELPVYVIIP